MSIFQNQPAFDLDALKAKTQQPSSTTLALRSKVATFFKATHKIWQAIPEEQRGLLATPEVRDEIISAATAFHCNEAGCVDVVYIKKDIPREALKHAEVGYWRKGAGPGPSLEQLEVHHADDIPAEVITAIRQTNDHTLIAHYLYAFVDFWSLILLHLLIWLAACFFYGYLCILCPTLIIGESSKLYRLFTEYGPAKTFRPNLNLAVFNDFLAGRFTLASLKLMCIVLDWDDWEDLKLDPQDYINILGKPVIVQYGPLPHHFAIYIPKYDPYGTYHHLDIREEFQEVDRIVRLIIRRARAIVKRKGPLPLQNREAALSKLLDEIMEDAEKLGLVDALNVAKLALKVTNLGTTGPAVSAAMAAMPEDKKGKRSAHATVNIAIRQEKAIRAVGEPNSEERRDWVIIANTSDREKLERGELNNLTACPYAFRHGTKEHGLWLFSYPGKDADISNSASSYNMRNPKDGEKDAEKERRLNNATGGSRFILDSRFIEPVEALRLLCLPPSLRKDGKSNAEAKITICECPICDRLWLVKSARPNEAWHTCKILRKEFLPELHKAATKRAEEKAKQASTRGVTSQVQIKQSMVTRREDASKLEWERGERLDEDDEIFALLGTKKKRTEKKKPTKADELWKRAMDERGRISLYSVKRTPVYYPSDLLQLSCFKTEYFQDPAAKPLMPKTISGARFEALSDFLSNDADYKAVNGVVSQKKKAKKRSDVFIAMPPAQTSEMDDAQQTVWRAWMLDQASALVADKKLSPSGKLEISLDQLREAFKTRIELDELDPFDYDPIKNKDLLIEAKADPAAPVASTSKS